MVFSGLKQRENEEKTKENNEKTKRKRRENEGKTEDRRKTRENPRKREEKKTTAPPNDLFSAVCNALSITHGLFEYSPGRLRGTLRFEVAVAVAVAGF